MFGIINLQRTNVHRTRVSIQIDRLWSIRWRGWWSWHFRFVRISKIVRVVRVTKRANGFLFFSMRDINWMTTTRVHVFVRNNIFRVRLYTYGLYRRVNRRQNENRNMLIRTSVSSVSAVSIWIYRKITIRIHIYIHMYTRACWKRAYNNIITWFYGVIGGKIMSETRGPSHRRKRRLKSYARVCFYAVREHTSGYCGQNGGKNTVVVACRPFFSTGTRPILSFVVHSFLSSIRRTSRSRIVARFEIQRLRRDERVDPIDRIVCCCAAGELKCSKIVFPPSPTQLACWIDTINREAARFGFNKFCDERRERDDAYPRDLI